MQTFYHSILFDAANLKTRDNLTTYLFFFAFFSKSYKNLQLLVSCFILVIFLDRQGIKYKNHFHDLLVHYLF